MTATGWHYDTISAFIKSIRGSDPDAALSGWPRWIHAGETPVHHTAAVISAAEDVGLADPTALRAGQRRAPGAEFIGWPEARIPIAEAAIYLATSNKSNSALAHRRRAGRFRSAARSRSEHLRDASPGRQNASATAKGMNTPMPIPAIRGARLLGAKSATTSRRARRGEANQGRLDRGAPSSLNCGSRSKYPWPGATKSDWRRHSASKFTNSTPPNARQPHALIGTRRIPTGVAAGCVFSCSSPP